MDSSRGLLRVVSNDELTRREQAAAQAQRDSERDKQEVLTGLAGYIMPLWEDAKRAKEEIRPRLLASLRQRRGEYEPDKLSQIKQVGGSQIFMMISSVKCRAAASWLRDALLGQGSDKPWTVSPTPNPQLPDDSEQQLAMKVGQEVGMLRAMGVDMPPDMVAQRLDAARESLKAKLREQARLKAEDTERILEDELIEGGFIEALDQFIDDFVTYPAAILKGPVIHREPTLTWQKMSGGANALPRWVPVVEDKLVKRWYRVDPFKFYPASWATDVDNGYCFEHHRLTRDALYAMIGSPGYDEEAIRSVLQEFDGLQNWLGINGYNTADQINQPEQLLSTGGPADALEFFGQVPGKYLIEWGVDDPQVDDPDKAYNVNLWMIGRWIIKATINPDPLGKKPYRRACYEEIPGAFWGNGVPDLIRDTQDVCNAAARSLVNNMAISSGPQVGVNTDRMPVGANVTQLYPWKVHQFTSSPMGSTEQPIYFFQPQSNAMDLVNVFTFFSNLADEYSGLPKYMTGDTKIGGAGRTSSGLSMLVGNANRLMKSVLGGVDRVIVDVLESLHSWLMQFAFNEYPELEGDIRIVARGSASVMAREQLAQRRNEFLQATANPVDMQVIGPDGRAYLLREQAKSLELDTDKIVPDHPQQPMAPQLPQPGQPGLGEMPGRPGQPAMLPMGNGGSPPAPPQNGRPIGALTDRIVA